MNKTTKVLEKVITVPSLSFLTVLVVIIPGIRSVEAQTAPIPAPNPMDILCNGKKLGTLNITDYSTAKFTDKDGNKVVGANLVAKFTKADPTQCNYDFKWIQSIYDGKGTIGQNNGATLPYLDPYKRDDNLPWYWTEKENSTLDIGVNGSNGPGSMFSDGPSQSEDNAGNFIKFETAFVCVNGLTISCLKGFTWGYEVLPDKTSKLFDFQWLNDATNNLKAPVIAWDGTKNNSGGGTPVGYNFSQDCNCVCIPEPNLSWYVFAFVSFVAVASRYRSLSSARPDQNFKPGSNIAYFVSSVKEAYNVFSK